MIAKKLIVVMSLLVGGCAAVPTAIMAGGAATGVKGIVDDASQDEDILTLKERIKHLENKLN